MSHFEPLTSTERLHLDLDDAHVHMAVGGVFVFGRGALAKGGGVDIDRIRAFVASRLYRVPRCRQRLVRAPLAGDMAWIDDAAFNLEYHVRHTHLPHPGDERQLKRLVGHIASQRLDREKPLWELHVVEGLAGDRFALVVKTHQCLATGVWEIGLIEALLSQSPTPEALESAPMWLPRPAPSRQDLLRYSLSRRLTAPFQIARIAFDAARSEQGLGAELREGIDGVLDATPASESPFNRPIGPHRRFDWLVTDADQAHAVADRFGVSLEAVVLSVLAGAVGRFFEQRGIPIADQRDFDMRVAIPEYASRDALAWMISDLPIAALDPLERLERTAEPLSNATRVGYGHFSAATDWIWPGLYAALARRQLADRASNLTVALVRGSASDRYLLGARLTEVYPLLPLVPDQALRVALHASGSRLQWGFNSDWDLLPDLHDLVRFTEDCFGELCAAAEVRAA